MALNPRLPSLMGFVCEDGSVHMVDANSQVCAILIVTCLERIGDRFVSFASVWRRLAS